MTTLRPYQTQAVESVWSYLRDNVGSPCVELPTGAGKTPVLVAISRQAVEQWSGRVLILAHVKELLAQAFEKFQSWWPLAPVGLYSAGLRRRDTQDQIVIAGIQSVYRRAAQLGRFDLIIVDEAHLVPSDGEGMYRALLADLLVINPRVRLIGLTATPFRLDCGSICGPDRLLTEICYTAGVRDLIDQGFLCRLRGKAGHEADISGVHVRGGEYIAGELEDALTDADTIEAAADDIVRLCAERHSWLVFCSGVKHAGMVRDALAERQISAALVTGDTPSEERASTLEAFKAGGLRCIVNVMVLTTGFDAPNVDAVVLLRPTLSPGLYYQMVGRGLRVDPSKTDCLVLDLAGNIARHGPIDQIDAGAAKKKGEGDGEAPVKNCPECQEIVLAGVAACPACGFVFPKPIAKHAPQAENVTPLMELRLETWSVDDVDYQPWTKKGGAPDAPKTMRVTYRCGYERISEWVCLQHAPGSFAHGKALQWWAQRSADPMPTLAEAVKAGNERKLREPSAITVQVGAKYPEIKAYVFAGPCGTCRHYDAGFCHRWALDVPKEHRESGCADWREVAKQAAMTEGGDDEPPF